MAAQPLVKQGATQPEIKDRRDHKAVERPAVEDGFTRACLNDRGLGDPVDQGKHKNERGREYPRANRGQGKPFVIEEFFFIMRELAVGDGRRVREIVLVVIRIPEPP